MHLRPVKRVATHPAAKYILLVQDNISTHTAGSLKLVVLDYYHKGFQKAVAKYQNRTILAEASAPEEIILPMPTYNVSTNFSSGPWVPSSCFDLRLNAKDSEKDIDECYNSINTTYDSP